MAKRKEVIIGLHNVFTPNTDNLYDISTFSYEQSVDENTILFAIADSEDVGKYITINGEPKIISENDNFIITDGIVFSGNGGGSGSSGSTCNCGYRTVQTSEELNSINGCEIGTVVYVIDEDKFYKYDGTDFSEIDLGGSHMLPKEVYVTLNISNNIPSISEAVGLDDIKTPGVYFLGSGYNQFPGILRVASSNSENDYVLQSYTNLAAYSKYSFTRQYTESSWSEWTSSSNDYTGGTNIDITGDVITAKGYVFNETTGSFKEGSSTASNTASGNYSHAEGINTTAQGYASHAEGKSVAIGDYSHAEGQSTTAEGNYSHAEGLGTITTNESEHAEGKYNVSNIGTISSIGIGTSTNRMNAVEVMASGDVYIKNIGDYNGKHLENVASIQTVISSLQEGIGGIVEEQITYTPGNNISISEEGVISALGYCYSNGDILIDQSCNIRGFLTANEEFISNGYATFKDNIVIKGSNDTTSAIINATSGNITTSGSMSAAQGFYETSDIRKKNVINELPLDKAYELINNCQSIIYTLKDNVDKQQIGLIAQEVQQYFPEVVSENEDGYLSLDYAKLTSVIFRVLKDVIDRLNKLENK